MSIHDNNLNKEKTQKRVLLATVISFAFFIAYDFLYLQPQQQEATAKAKIQQELQLKQQAATPAQNTAAPTATPALNSAAPVMTQTDANSAPVAKVQNASDIVSTITTNKNIIEIDSLGRVAQVTLLEEQYIDEDGNKIKLFNATQLRPLEIRFSDTKINKEAFEVQVQSSAAKVDATVSRKEIILTQTLSDTVLTKKLTVYPDGHYDITAQATNAKEFFITPGFRPDVLADMYADHGLMLKLNDSTLNIVEDEDLEKSANFTGVKFASAFDRYYATVFYNFDTSMALSIMPDNEDNPQAFIHAKDKITLSGYMGPKTFNTLQELHVELTDVIEYGWFTFIAKPMFILLQYIHDYVGNWGWTIVLLTILIKLVLYPLSYKGMVSMNKLKELAPKIKQIQEKYKGDSQKSSAHMMELYKKEGANPMGGCLPIILQIPVFFAIYRVLLNAIELKGAEWIWWIEDLAEMDPYFVLPILMGATMFLQQQITPNTIQDEMQKKMFQWLPVVFTFFFLWFPAGLTLYWFINNLFTVAQQYYVNTLFEKAKVARHEEHIAAKQKKD
ncbi:MAG: membrane protein insertase YidC [Campylobacterota bacterium]|nr:membrane protein insertase YidC [Campylobacterota bacterium]